MRKLKIFGYPWHVGHQYELAKLPFVGQYDLLINPWRKWGDRSRPMPDNMSQVYKYEPGKYDLAILHVDQQSIDPILSNKYHIFTHVNRLITDIPKVVINHMTPYQDGYETWEVIDKLKAMVGDVPMITNSKQAAQQWGWGYPIIHGMEIDEWLDLPKEPRIVTFVSAGGMEKAYRRKLLLDTMSFLKEMGLDMIWIGNHPLAKFNSFDEYRNFLGRSLIYFHGLWNSPMPRSRTEAMLSGACIVSTRHQDWDSYVEDGKNGFIIPDNPWAAAKLLKRLLVDEPELALKVGKAGRKMARQTFNSKNFQDQWVKFVTNELKIKL